MKKQLNELGIHILNASRNELYLSMRFLDTALYALPYEMNQNTFFMGTDGEKILFNPRFLAEKYEYHPVLVNRCYLHMLIHCIFRHLFNREERDEEYWNLACDIVVESVVDSFPYRCLTKVMSDKREELYDSLKRKHKVLTAQNVYQDLKERSLTYQEFYSLTCEFLVDDHKFWDSKKQENEKEQNNNQDNKREEELQKNWQKLSEKMETNLETFCKSIGSNEGGFLKALQIENRERYDMRSFLQKFAVIREETQIDLDSFDYAFYHYGMELYGNMPLIEELEYKEVNRVEEFVIAIDTSGSCSGGLIKAFLRKACGILKDTESFLKKVHIHMIQCDKEIQEDVCITNLSQLDEYLDQFETKGYGGTDFRPVFDYVNQLVAKGELSHLKGMLYFTDGLGIYPKQRPSYDVAFVFMKNDYTDEKVPVWAMKLILDPEELER